MNTKTPFQNPIKKGLDFFKYNGISGVLSKVKYKMTGPGLAYNGWFKDTHDADEEELLRQREERFVYEPVISILVPVFLTPELYLRTMIESVKNQTYSKWELCIVDGSQAKLEDRPAGDASAYDVVYSLETERIIREIAETDDRIKYRLLEQNQGICGSMNVAIMISSGDYILPLNHDDLLTEDALYQIVKALNEKQYDIVYSDEDRCSSDGTKYSDPSFKPDFSMDLLRSYNYIGHVTAIKKNIATRIQGYNKDYEGAEDYDFILRCVEETDASNIKHISRIMYHARIKPKSQDNSAHKKEIYGDLAKRALSTHLDRTVSYATAVRTDMPGVAKVIYETPGNPKISIIIPGSDNTETMKKCIYPLFELARYSNFEIIIVDNIGEYDKVVSLFYRRLEEKRRNVKVITDSTLTDLPQMRNKGASRATGDYLLFLDSEVEIIEPNSIGDMLGNCLRSEVAIVGGTTFNDANAIHRQGLVIGLNGIYDCPNKGIKKGNFAYLMGNCINTDCTAVSPCCMMVKTSVYDKLGGFDTSLGNELSAIDFCLKARQLNYLVVSLADAIWWYHGNNSIKLEKDLLKDKRFTDRWSYILQQDDPYYNANFTRSGEPYTL